MKTSELLRGAKGRLARNYAERLRPEKTGFVCLAICPPGGLAPRKAKTVVKRIDSALGGYTTVCGWLEKEGGVILPYERKKCYDALQSYRHRWLDALIAEYEAEGD